MIHSLAIQKFFSSRAFGVIGASNDPAKFGFRVLQAYLRRGLKAYPVNPKASEILGLPCLSEVAQLPVEVESISIITPPAVTEQIVVAAIAHGIRHVWMQPGAESRRAIELCQQAGVDVIGDGSCVLVELC